MRPEYVAALADLAPYAVAIALFRAEGRRVEVLLRQPDWMRPEGHWMLPEFELEPGQTITGCAENGVRMLTGIKAVSATNFETRIRGASPLGGVVSTCFACVPKKSNLRSASGARHRWAPVDSLPTLLANYDRSIEEALKALSYSPKDVAVLVSSPEFTIAELRDGLNEVRRLASVKGQVDIRNLRRQLDGSDWMNETGRMSSGAHRPAKLYVVQ